MNTINYYRKNVYGSEFMYIEKQKEAETIQRLTKQKTLSTQDKLQLESLGVRFQEVIAPKA